MAFNTAPGRAEYTASAAQTIFTFSFKIFNTSDVKVYLTPVGQTADDTADILIETTDYTVTINGDNGGDVTLTSGATLNDAITLVRDLPVDRDVEYQHAGDLAAAALNEDQDYQTYLILDGSLKTNERALIIPDTAQEFDTTLPAPGADKMFIYASDGKSINLIDPSNTDLFKEAFIVNSMQALLGVDETTYGSVNVRGYYSISGGGGGLFNWDSTIDKSTANAGTIIDPDQTLANQGNGTGNGCWVRQDVDIITPEQFGAIGGGVADDTAILQKVLSLIHTNGGGTCLIENVIYGISDTLLINSNTRLIGSGDSKIKAISSFSGAMIQFGYTTAVITDADTNPCENSSIENIEVDANFLVSPKDFDPTVLLPASLISGVVYIWRNSPNNKVLDCEIHSAESGLLSTEDGADFLEIKNNEIHNAKTTSVATQYINLMNIDGATNAVIENNNVYDLIVDGYSPSSWGYALRLHATDNCTVTGNNFASGYHNILVDGRSNLILNNYCSKPSSTAITLFQNDYGCRYNTIIGNLIDNDPDTYTPTGFGVREALSGTSPDSAKVSNNYINNNTIANASTALLLLSTSGSHSIGNVSVTGNILDGSFGGEPTENIINDSVDSGVYTPSLTNQSNIDASTAYECQYMRVNDVITVSGHVGIDPTATGGIELRLSIPIGGNFTQAYQAAGTFHDTYNQHGGIQGLSGGALVRLQANLSDASNRDYFFHFTYKVQ